MRPRSAGASKAREASTKRPWDRSRSPESWSLGRSVPDSRALAVVMGKSTQEPGTPAFSRMRPNDASWTSSASETGRPERSVSEPVMRASPAPMGSRSSSSVTVSPE
ncbi:hypothetical protein ACN28S_44320 [Cystobacter fuscus]